MEGKKRQQLATAALCGAALMLGTRAYGYQYRDTSRWTSTATDGVILNPSQGKPTTVTWSIIPDGGGGTPASRLVAFFDALYPGGSGDDLTQRPWFFIFEESFDRFNELSGLTFVYEPNDDGIAMTFGNAGVLGVRGDIRIRAHPIDGQVSPSIAARTFYPPNGDMTIDSDNTDIFGQADFNSRGARNIIMHEIGHGIGIDHVESDDANFLMEPKIILDFDGPQLDDILAIHRGYGDFYEKSNNGQGNDTAALATPLGALTIHSPRVIGADAADAVVDRDDVDFVSIDDASDIDFYSFSIDSETQVRLILTPHGPSYLQGPQGKPEQQFPLDSAGRSDLALLLLDRDGVTPLAFSDTAGFGLTEMISDVLLTEPGTYYARVTGLHATTQLYQLDVQVVPEPSTLLGLLIGGAFMHRRRGR